MSDTTRIIKITELFLKITGRLYERASESGVIFKILILLVSDWSVLFGRQHFDFIQRFFVIIILIAGLLRFKVFTFELFVCLVATNK